MRTVFVVLKRQNLVMDRGSGTEPVDLFAAVRTTLAGAMVAAYKAKPAVVLEVSTKPGDGDEPVERAEIK